MARNLGCGCPGGLLVPDCGVERTGLAHETPKGLHATSLLKQPGLVIETGEVGVVGERQAAERTMAPFSSSWLVLSAANPGADCAVC